MLMTAIAAVITVKQPAILVQCYAISIMAAIAAVISVYKAVILDQSHAIAVIIIVVIPMAVMKPVPGRWAVELAFVPGVEQISSFIIVVIVPYDPERRTMICQKHHLNVGN